VKENLLNDTIARIKKALASIQLAKSSLLVFESQKNWRRADIPRGERDTFDSRFYIKFSFLTFSASHFYYQAGSSTESACTLVKDGHRELLDYIRTIDADAANKEFIDAGSDSAQLSVNGIMYAALSGLHYAEVEMEEAVKAADVLRDSANWRSKEDGGRLCNYFNFHNLDPCIIAYQGREHLDKAVSVLAALESKINSWVYSSGSAIKIKVEGNA
jgi:hypothetical protein